MIGFSYSEIIITMLLAAVYGSAFAVSLSLLRTLHRLCSAIFLSVLLAIRDMDCVPTHSSHFNIIKNERRDAFALFFKIVFFFVGIIIVSYWMMDGVIRLFVIVIAVIGYYSMSSTFCVILESVFIRTVEFLAVKLNRLIKAILRTCRILFGLISKKMHKLHKKQDF